MTAISPNLRVATSRFIFIFEPHYFMNESFQIKDNCHFAVECPLGIRKFDQHARLAFVSFVVFENFKNS
jgi:hypothetical protein